jgi:hypothetical protein
MSTSNQQQRAELQVSQAELAARQSQSTDRINNFGTELAEELKAQSAEFEKFLAALETSHLSQDQAQAA